MRLPNERARTRRLVKQLAVLWGALMVFLVGFQAFALWHLVSEGRMSLQRYLSYLVLFTIVIVVVSVVPVAAIRLSRKLIGPRAPLARERKGTAGSPEPGEGGGGR